MSAKATSMKTGTTELSTLELDVAVPEPAPGHWRELGQSKRLMLFSGRSHPELAGRIGERLGLELGEVTLKTFADGETYCRYEESVRGADLFLVQTGSEPVDRHLMELLIMIQAAKLASAKRVTAVVPWFPYSRQDKKSAPREPVTGKLVADFLQTAGVDRVLTMDLHAGQIQGFFQIPVDHMTALPLFAQYFRDRGIFGEGVVSVSPDPGRAKMAVRFSQMLEADFAIMHKTRPGHDVAQVTEVTGRVRGKVALMGDDIIATGGTLVSGARALKEAGAKEVYVFATHGLFAGDSLERFANAEEVDAVVVTDTLPLDPRQVPDKVTQLTVSSLLAETIWNVFSEESVSAIFAGENQLF
jgi:ribose-phosphate pyrophosphokinase